MRNAITNIITGTIAVTAIWGILYVTLALGVLGLMGYMAAVALGVYIVDCLNISRIWEK